MKIHKAEQTRPRIYVSGGWGYGNKGDNAILKATLASLNAKLDTPDIVLTSYSVEELKDYHGLDSVPSLHCSLIGLRGKINHLRFALWKLSRGRTRLPKAIKAQFDLIKSADLVILAGGGYFNGSWDNMAKAQYVLLELTAQAGTPAMIYGQTVGPFSRKDIAGPLGPRLRLLDRVVCRDELSVAIAAEAGVPSARLGLSSDEANLLPVIAAEDTGDKPYVTIGLMVQNFRPHEGKYGRSQAGQITKANYFDTLIAAFRKIAAEKKVVFRAIPSTSWDEKGLFRLIRAMEDAGLSVELAKVPTVDAYVGACQSVDIMISTNMHPVILASTASKPSMALTYNFKLDEYMAQIGMQDFMRPIDDFDAETLSAMALELISNRKKYADHVASHHAVIKERARINSATAASYFAL